MNFISCFERSKNILTEGALVERLKREYGIPPDENLLMAALACDDRGRAALGNLWREYAGIAAKYRLPFMAMTPTRRANQERVERSGVDSSVLAENVRLLEDVRETVQTEMYIGGLMGCRGDAYTGEGALTEQEAECFHKWQADLLCGAGVDYLYAGIMPFLSEAAGMARAMAQTGLPYIISFTVQKDGRLIDGTSIADAIGYIDALPGGRPLCYMANCVHPRIVYEALSQPFNRNKRIFSRFLGIQANTSPLSYAELEGSADLQCSEPEAFAEDMLKLRENFGLKIFGGCCGTDGRHLEALAKRL